MGGLLGDRHRNDPKKRPSPGVPHTITLEGLREQLNSTIGYQNTLLRFGEDPVLMKSLATHLFEANRILSAEIERRADLPWPSI